MTKVQIGDATLYLGDCAEILPTLGRFDAIVTDPPYGIGRDGSRESTGAHGGRKAYEFKKWDRERPSYSAFSLMLQFSKYQIIWGGNYFSDYLPPTQKWLVWDKGQRINQSDGELAWTSMSGALRIFTLNRVALLIDGSDHPTQKPLKLMQWCISQLPADVETICDPFMGSGTTGVAAIQAGKKFVGIEREPAYFETAVKRIKEASDQGRLFVEPKRKPVAHPAIEFENE